eukprot:TRINITY_DN827_c0_g1_i2.p1 TRINITY_DN827_c0_g1~~TRINITY_DN827_c0_g1_i2.p1  ORF type:complete len:377 (-),score=80.50 TRINITY_DN827_c0_g1_i2:194-1324(-)
MGPQTLVCRQMPCFSAPLSASYRILSGKHLGIRIPAHAKLHKALASPKTPSSLHQRGISTRTLIGSFPGSRLLVRAVTVPTVKENSFDEMLSEVKRKYYMLGGKGGVGKTSCAASLAVKFANNGHPTLVVSTDPAHSLSDSFDQNLSGGHIVAVDGTESPLFALEINPEQARAEYRAKAQASGSSGVMDFMDSMGLGGLAEQLGELKLGELLDTPPPGLDEAIAISKVMQFVESPQYAMFTRIVFDTAPTGHTLRLLSLPDFLDASIGKILKLKQKLASAANTIKSVFGQGRENQESPTDKLEQLKESMGKVRELFRDKDSTEFVIVTIPTDQLRALEMIQKDPVLADLEIVQAPLVDVEIRGVPALKFMGDIVWR